MEYGYFDAKRRHVIWTIMGIPFAAMLIMLGMLPVSAVAGDSASTIINIVIMVLTGGALFAAYLLASRFIIGIQYKLAFSLMAVASLIGMLFSIFVILQGSGLYSGMSGSMLTIELAFMMLIVGINAGAYGIFAFAKEKRNGLVFGFSLAGFILAVLLFVFLAVYLVVSTSVGSNATSVWSSSSGVEILIWLSVFMFLFLNALARLGFYLGLFFASSRQYEVNAGAAVSQNAEAI